MTVVLLPDAPASPDATHSEVLRGPSPVTEPARTGLPRVLMVHNTYQQSGGEDRAVAAETRLLRRRGHAVLELRRDNRDIAHIGRLQLASDTIWSHSTYRDTLEAIRAFAPDVVHVHNAFPLISPSMHWACSAAGVPVVQTLHNFRLACPQAMLLREGKICERCLGGSPWPAVLHGCYRGSRAQTAVVVAMTSLHRLLGTYETRVSRYIALNAFCRAKFIQAGLPAERIVVKPNFVDEQADREDDGASGAPAPGGRRGLLYVGRLAPEKGLEVLADAWTNHDTSGATLRVAGEGPTGWPGSIPSGVTRLGVCTPAQVRREMASAVALVMPSLWYENLPMTLVEAFAAGLPVIASRIGALAELIEDGHTGLLVEPGDPKALAEAMRWALEHPERMAGMGARARLRYEALYTPDINYRQLSAIYGTAIAQSRLDARRGDDPARAHRPLGAGRSESAGARPADA